MDPLSIAGIVLAVVGMLAAPVLDVYIKRLLAKIRRMWQLKWKIWRDITADCECLCFLFFFEIF
jgi:hypothetical protein